VPSNSRYSSFGVEGDIVSALWSLGMSTEAPDAFSYPKRQGFCTRRSPPSRLGWQRTFCSQVLVSWQPGCRGRTAFTGAGKNLSLCLLAHEVISFFGSGLGCRLLSACVWYAGADGCVRGWDRWALRARASPVPGNHECRGRGLCILGLSCARSS